MTADTFIFIDEESMTLWMYEQIDWLEWKYGERCEDF